MAEPFFNFVFYNVFFFGSQNDCICLENNRHVTDSSGRIVSGSYSYLDPVGSLITVTYTNGADGYKERRRVQKNYGQVSTAEVAAEALEGMRAEVLGAIDVVLGGSTVAPSASTSVLVTRVLTRLRPAVARAARASLSAAVGDAGVVDEAQVASVVDEITVELRPFIASRVDQRRAAQQVTTTTTTTTANDLVSRIISQLRPAIISTVQREVSVRKPVTTTVVQQPVKQQQVFTTVTTTKDEFSDDLITDLVSQLQDAIQTVVNDVIVGYQGVITDGDVLVEEIVTRLQPTIRSVISTTVRRRGLNYSAGKVDRLNTRVVEGIRPVIRQTVE